MKNFISALIIGIIFGVGISISGMINPAKVLNFFDLAGTWDPSLALVMGSALIVAMIGYKIIFGSFPKPAFAEKFAVPSNTTIDGRLLAGSAIFGIGWGISGFCPGGAIPAIGMGDVKSYIFVASMIAGIWGARLIFNFSQRGNSAA